MQKIRKEYGKQSLNKEDLAVDPIEQFNQWFQETLASGIEEPNAMALATSDHGRPSCRMVLLKEWNQEGFIFFTHYNSRKGIQLSSSPHAAATFFWQPLEKQVCIEGCVEKISEEKSLAYFHKRPRKSQLAAWASHQDTLIESRLPLEKAMEELSKKYENQEIPLPDYWGGYRIVPVRIEFWQGRRDRLHDRFVYTRIGKNWEIQRLSP